MSVTIKKIAQLAEVSITTVSKVINGKDQDLRPGTVARVKAIIEQENYRPSVLAQSMRNRQMRLIALMIPDIRNPFFTEIIRGCEACTNKYNYSLVLCHTSNKLDKEIEYINSLQSRHIDGVVLSGLQIQDRIIDNQLRISVPFCFVTGNRRSGQQNSERSLGSNGSFIATNHLIKLGHRNILFTTGPSIYSHSHDGLAGYTESLKLHNIPLNKNNIINLSAFTAEVGFNELLPILKTTKATAIVCGNDLIAYGVLMALRKLKRSVPSEMSVIGYDDIEFNQFMTPALTSVNGNRYALGWDTTLELIEKIEERVIEDYTPNVSIKLVERETCAPLKP